MTEEGTSRIEKYIQKYDPNAIMLRYKTITTWSKRKFFETSQKHYTLDDEIRTLIDRYLLPYGKAGEFMDFVRKLVYSWGMLSDAEKEFYRLQWIEKGFPIEAFDKIAEYYYILANTYAIFIKNNMVIWFFAELEPKPFEAYVPKEEDFITKMETEYETYIPKYQDYWFQYGMGIGANIFFLGNVFKGFDADPLLTHLILQTYRSDVGLTLDLFIPAIMRELPEYFILQFIPEMLYEIEVITPEIAVLLSFIDPVLSYGINEHDLWIYQMIRETINVFEGITKSYVNSPALSYTSDVRESQILINALPNPSYEVSI